MIKKTIALQLAIFLASGNVSGVELTAPESANIDTTAGVGPTVTIDTTAGVGPTVNTTTAFDGKDRNAPKKMSTIGKSYVFNSQNLADLAIENCRSNPLLNRTMCFGSINGQPHITQHRETSDELGFINNRLLLPAILSQVVINGYRNSELFSQDAIVKIWQAAYIAEEVLNGFRFSICSLDKLARFMFDLSSCDKGSCSQSLDTTAFENGINKYNKRRSLSTDKPYGHVLGWDKRGDSNNKLFCKKGGDLLFKGLYNIALRQKHGTMLEDYKIWIDEGHDITKKLYNLYDSLITDESGNEILDLELKTDEMVHIQHMAMPMSKDGINCLKKRLNLDFLEKVGEFSSEDFNKDAKILIGFFEANIGKNIGENIGKNARNKKQLLKKLRDWSGKRSTFLGGLNSLDKICRALDEEFLIICKKVGLEWTELPFEETLSWEAKNKDMENFNKLDLKAPEVETLENKTGGKKRDIKEKSKSNSNLSKIEKDQSKY